jgi:flagellar hook-length control protein FliK
VRLPDNNGGSTQVRFVESGGEVRVSVRTADEGLAQNLRTHLNDLSQRLAEGGIPAEIWKPAADSASSQNNNQHQPDRDGRGSNGQPSGGQDGQSDRQQKRPAWLEEMEASLLGPQV